MKIACLMENTACSPQFECKHGLGLYIETDRHKLLFDLGDNDGIFSRNAERLGIDLKAVELAVISHGHHDHGGALPLLLELNKTAPVYLQGTAFEPHYAASAKDARYIGLDAELRSEPRLKLLDGDCRIADDLLLFAGVGGRRCLSDANSDLRVERNGQLEADDFRHEQSLIVTEQGRHYLIAGCAHSGIVNIIDEAKTRYGISFDAVISGFHLANPTTGAHESREFVHELAEELLKTSARFFTCHCTGQKPFEFLQEVMHERVAYLSAGTVITI